VPSAVAMATDAASSDGPSVDQVDQVGESDLSVNLSTGRADHAPSDSNASPSALTQGAQSSSRRQGSVDDADVPTSISNASIDTSWGVPLPWLLVGAAVGVAIARRFLLKA
jgi:hypothetical protein